MYINKNETNKWFGIYRGVAFEINNFITEAVRDIIPEKENWTYYLRLQLDRIPKESDPKSYWLEPQKDEKFGRTSYKYYQHQMADLNWHGGMTWYSKETGIDDTPKSIKIGCDYQHIWDEGVFYNIDFVTRDVQNTIDDFLLLVPNYKYRCGGNGKLYKLSEGIVQKNGRFSSEEYWGDKEWYKKLKDEQSKEE